jgi:hypothetical protein
VQQDRGTVAPARTARPLAQPAPAQVQGRGPTELAGRSTDQPRTPETRAATAAPSDASPIPASTVAVIGRCAADGQTGCAAVQQETALRRERASRPAGIHSRACAQQHGANILHVDRHFDALAEVFGFRSLRLSG